MSTLSLHEKLEKLKQQLIRKKGKIKDSVSMFFLEKGHYVIFLSFTDGNDRALVINARERTFEKSWQLAIQQLKKKMFVEKVKPTWIKADLVTEIKTLPYQNLLTDLTQIKRNHFFEGISFDPFFRAAFLEQEINANVFFNNWGSADVELSLLNTQIYIKEHRKINLKINLKNLAEVYLFKTVSAFQDTSKSYEIESNMICHGHREIDITDEQEIYEVIDNSARALARRMDPSGYFEYVNYPAFDKTHQIYGVGHHALSISAMLAAYEVTNDELLKNSIERGLQVILKQRIISLSINAVTYSFVKENDETLNLYASAQIVLALLKHRNVFGTPDNDEVLEQLIYGLLYYQQEDGSFAHALYEDGTLKEQKINMLYDGAALLALVRFLQIDPNQALSDCIKRGFKNLIDQEAWKNGDYLLNHAAIEFFYQHPKIDYATFVLKSTKHQLNGAFTHDTSAGVLIEYFVATYHFINVLEQNGIQTEVFSSDDLQKLERLIQHRAKQQLNAYVWPEVAMYFATPKYAVHNFYVREDSFRMRIDDLATNLSSYYYYFALLKNLQANESFEAFFVDKEAMKESEILLFAKQFDNQHQSTRAIVYFDSFIEENQKYMDITYASYAKYLRLSGNIGKAKMILGRGITYYPTSEAILVEFLHLALGQNDYSSIVTIASDLIKINPTEVNYYVELGRALADVGEMEKAQAAFKVGLIHAHHLSTEQLIRKIQQGITNSNADISSTYTFLGGKNNLGVILHKMKGKEYFTKITRQTTNNIRERLFYEKVLSVYPQLQGITPAFIAAEDLDDIQYVTIEKIEDIKKEVTVDEVLLVAEQITAVSYQEIVDKFPNRKYTLRIGHRTAQSSFYFFVKIHEKRQNEYLFKALYTYVAEYSIEEMYPIIQRMEEIVMDNKLYDAISPRKHYSLLHGDFKLDNMSINKDGELKVLDWGEFMVGPHFLDMALFFSTLSPAFSEIEDKYLENTEMNRTLSVPEKIYFSLALMINYLILITPENKEYMIKGFILPVLTYMETQESLLDEHKE